MSGMIFVYQGSQNGDLRWIGQLFGFFVNVDAWLGGPICHRTKVLIYSKK